MKPICLSTNRTRKHQILILYIFVCYVIRRQHINDYFFYINMPLLLKKNPQWRMRRSPAYIETPQIRLPPAVNISHQNIRGVHSEHTQNFIYPSLKCKWPIHTKLLAPNDLISLSYRTHIVFGTTTYIMNWKKIDWNILVLTDQCSRTFWAFSRYRYRDTITLEVPVFSYAGRRLAKIFIYIRCRCSTPLAATAILDPRSTQSWFSKSYVQEKRRL